MLVGLNASRDILLQVEMNGFDSFTPNQLGSLEPIICIVLAGNNHCWKHGIPKQIAQRNEMTIKVILLEAPGRVNRNTITPEEADDLWLDYGRSVWLR